MPWLACISVRSLGSEDGEGRWWCVLGGVQVHTPASWETGSANQGRMGPCGVAANEGLWSWSDGRQGWFPQATEEEAALRAW